MASTSTLLAAENEILEKIRYYTDWEGDVAAPYAVTIDMKREGQPRLFLATATFPLATVRVTRRYMAAREGRQNHMITNVRVELVRDIAVDDEPDAIIRNELGKIQENILGTKELTGDWLGLGWVSDIEMPITDFESDTEKLLRQLVGDEVSGPRVAGAADFPISFYYVEVA